MTPESISTEKHLTTAVFLVTEELPRKVLLLFHNKLQVWLPPGGHVEPHENPFEGAIREVREETGIDITPHIEPPFQLDERVKILPAPVCILEEPIAAYRDEPAHHHVDFVYIVPIPFQAPRHNENESRECRWFSQDEIKDLQVFENLHYFFNKIWIPEPS